MKSWLWIAALAASIGFVIIDSRARQDPMNGLTAQAARTLVDTSVAQHSRIVPVLGADGYQWAMQTQQMLRGGGLRVRHVEYDGPSGGRDVHWSGSLHWAAAVAAFASHAFTHRSTDQAVEDVFPWVNTVLFVLLLIGLATTAARRFGPVPATFVSIAAVATYPVYELFVAGNFDHHGIAAFAALGSVLGIARAYLQRASGSGQRATAAHQLPVPNSPFSVPNSAFPGFVAAGVLGGMGLWISAATEVPVLIAIGVAAVVNVVFFTTEQDPVAFAPDLWRTWGIAGAITSLALYALEYAPSGISLHLEVNHPLYALAWFGAGDLLFRIYRMKTSQRSNRDVAACVVDAVLIFAVPATMLLVPDSFSLRPNSFIVALHEDYITEFRTLGAQVAHWSVTQWLAGIGLLIPATLLPAGFLVFSKRTAAPVRAVLTLVSLPVVVFVLLALREGRWLNVAATLSLAVLVVLLTVSPRARATGTPHTGFAVALGLALVPFPLLTISRWTAQQGAYPQTREDFAQLVTRDVAQKLRGRLGSDEGLVLSGPTTSTWITWFGGERTLGTLYWENEKGLRQSAEIFASRVADAKAQDSTLALLRRRGITHIVVFSWNAFATEYARLSLDLRANSPLTPADQKRIDDSFGVHLLNGDIPFWLRPLIYRVPEIAGSNDDWALVLEVAPDQSEADAAVASAQFSLAMNSEENAVLQLQAAMTLQTGHLPASIALARIQSANPKRGDFRATLLRIESGLRSADSLSLDSRVSLASLYVAVGDTAKAAAQIRRAILGANETSIRRMPWDYTPANLLILARQFGLLDLRPGLMSLAYELLDPVVQAQLPPPAQR